MARDRALPASPPQANTQIHTEWKMSMGRGGGERATLIGMWRIGYSCAIKS